MWDSGIIAVLVGTETLEVGLNTLSKAAMRRGMSNFVFVLYQNALAILFLAPLTFIYHRIRSPPPKLTFSILCRIILLGIIGGWLQMFMFTGIGLSSPTLASAMSNLTPAYTFILAGITGYNSFFFFMCVRVCDIVNCGGVSPSPSVVRLLPRFMDKS